MKVGPALFLAAVVLTGCQTIPPGAERGPDGTMAFHVPVETSEPGARIEVNGEMVGTSPLTLKIFGDPDGTFHDFGSYEFLVRAYPARTNQFTQTRVFLTGRMFAGEDRIPPQIYFDLNQPPPVYAPPPPYPPGFYPYPYYYHYHPPMFYGPRIYINPRPRHHHHHHNAPIIRHPRPRPHRR
ncbi:MAG TPA: hypothetical protein VEH04_17675 [Verrucomicrobiae bacterium]|nr:hypothetical protein [Verrucomicrobiae bacterium]